MNLLSLPRSRRRGAGRRPATHRRSVLHHLVALALVPTLALPVFAGLFTQDRLDEASAARRIGRAMVLVEDLEHLRTAVASEAAASGVASIAARYDLEMEQLEEILGPGVIVPLDTARAEVDRAFEAVDRDPDTDAAVAEMRATVRTVRKVADASFSQSEPAAEFGWELYEMFNDVHRGLANIQEAVVGRVATGHYGAGSVELLTAAAQLQRVTTVVEAGKRQATYLQGFFAATTAEDRATVISDLREKTVSWRTLSADLPRHLSPQLGETWQKIIADPDVHAFDAFIDEVIRPDRPNDQPSPSMPGATDTARTAIVLTSGLSDLVHQSVVAGEQVARQDRVAAEQRARLALATTVLLLLMTGAFIFLIGGTIRSRLRGLATAAERFSAGQLEEMPVHGPREIAVASGALNDAVASLRRVAVQAERLSAGDLDAPELKEAAPGALGTAVHSSVQRIVCAVREGEKLREELAHQAAHDDLTHLPNRAETERLLGHALARAHRSEGRVAVLFVDLDHFKQCNDSVGHAAGDHVLRTAASRMTTVVRPGDTVCRLGGDEFVVVVEPVGTDRSVVEIAERITAALAQPITYGDSTIVVGGSVGVAISDAGSDADSLLREADSAMYQAKETARGSVEVFNETLRAELHRETAFRAAMADGLANGEFELHYQPVLDVASGRLHCVEALARWRRPGIGMVGPDQFIPVAESCDFILAIGRWALRTATAQLVEWSADPAYASVQVAVNLSGRHLAQPGVLDDVRDALAASGLAPGRLVVEVTETMAIDSPATISHLAQLAEMGVRVSLDDFGTGYTSIGQLLHLPIHILKIDRSLVSGTNEDGSAVLERSTRIIDLIVEVAHSLKLDVVAEGVEEQTQLTKLQEAGCEGAQGYFFSKPLPVDQVPAWVSAHTASLDRHSPAAT